MYLKLLPHLSCYFVLNVAFFILAAPGLLASFRYLATRNFSPILLNAHLPVARFVNTNVSQNTEVRIFEYSLLILLHYQNKGLSMLQDACICGGL